MKKHLLLIAIFFVAGRLLAQTILGIDISHYQGNPNWTQVAAAGKVFAWVKSTEGVSYTDPTYASNMTNGTNAGVVMGAYHFARPITNSATAEANYFVSVAGSTIGAGHMPPALDLEDPPSGSGLTSSMTSTALTAWVQTWMTTVQNATGVTPVIYTSSSIAAYVNSSLNIYKLWIAKPDGSPTTAPTGLGVWSPNWAFKQYSWTGVVSGISASDVDLDVFNGTLNDFNTLIGASTSPPLCSNDDICSATALPINSSCSNTACSTVNASPPSPTIPYTGASSCTSTYQSGRYDDDVWFAITPSSANPITITVTPTSNTANFDVALGLYQGTCSSPTQVTCADLYSAGVAETINCTPVSGTTYYIRVFSYGIGSSYSGNFNICVSSPCVAPTKPTITGSHTVCSGQSTTLTLSNPCSGCTYSWSNSGSGTSTTVSSSAFYTVTATNSCSTTVSDPFGVTVTSQVTPSVSISASVTTICPGSSITFTASPTNGGTTPTYQWTKNSVNINGVTSSTYSSTTLSNNDTIRVVLTSNASCISTSTATSNAIIVTVSPTVVPTISIAANPTGTICSGTNVSFTASITNGGTTPVYSWKKNGTTIGSNASSYSSSSALANGDIVTCSLTSNASCPSSNPVSSNSVTMSVTATVTPTVSISANTGTSICTGQSVSFTATPTNGGNSPTYQWKLNGNDVATGSTYTNSSLSSGDLITCVMTSSLSNCITQATGTSNSLTMNVSGTVSPTIFFAPSAMTICAGTSVTFTPSISGGGSSPGFQWKKNGNNISSANSSTYTTTTLSDGDLISCELTSSASCASPTTITSNNVSVFVSQPVAPTINITSLPIGAVCTGTGITFSSSINNGGNSPVYQWKKNGSNISGETSSTYTSSALNNGDVINCELTSNGSCVSPLVANSNSIAANITASVTPVVSITSNAGTNICQGTNVNFTSTSNNGGNNPIYQWKINGNVVGTGATYSSSNLQNGDAITCEMTSSLTCVTQSTVISNTLTITTNVPVTPVVSISSNSGLIICSGASVTFNATSVNGGNTPVYEWKVNATPVTTGSPYTTALLNNGDVVTCDMTSSLTCLTNATVTSNVVQMIVSGNVTPVIQENNCELAATYIPNVSYQWYANSFLISGAITRFYTVDQTGYYYVMVTDSNSCKAQSSDAFASYPACLPNGVDELNSDYSFEIYQRTNDLWQLTVKEISNQRELEIFDAMGQLVLRQPIQNSKSEIELSAFSPGLYFVKISDDEKQFLVKKILKF